jgi:hypothetical protein
LIGYGANIQSPYGKMLFHHMLLAAWSILLAEISKAYRLSYAEMLIYQSLGVMKEGIE